MANTSNTAVKNSASIIKFKYSLCRVQNQLLENHWGGLQSAAIATKKDISICVQCICYASNATSAWWPVGGSC